MWESLHMHHKILHIPLFYDVINEALYVTIPWQNCDETQKPLVIYLHFRWPCD